MPSGLDVAPGFVDVHSHSDYTLLVDPRAVSALHQGVTTEVVGNCGHGCFPIARSCARATRDLRIHAVVAAHLARCGRLLRAARGGGPAVNVASLVPNGQLRLAVVGLEDRPAPGTSSRRCACSSRSRSSRAPGDSRPASSTRRSVPRRRTSSARSARSARGRAACTRRTRATATSAPRTPWTRRSRPPRAPASVCRSPTSSRGTASTRPVPASTGSSGRRARARHRLRHAHAPLRHDVPLDGGPARIPAQRSDREPRRAPRGRRGDGVVHEHPERRRRLVTHRAPRQRPVAGVRPARPRLDRRRPASDGSRGDLRPPRGGARRARDADGDHPLLHGGPAGGGLPPPSLRARLRRDDPRARRAARDVLLPRRVHVGRLVPPLHGSRARAALARGGRQAPDERSCGAGRPTGPRRAPRGRVRRRRRPRLGRGARDRDDVRAEPAGDGVRTCSSTASRR